MSSPGFVKQFRRRATGLPRTQTAAPGSAGDAFDIAPILAILSPVKGCGKTTLPTILNALVWRPQLTSNISPAALFRVIDAYHPTLLVDEIDTQFQHGNEDLRGILNAGHSRTAAKVIRADKGGGDGADFEPRVFDVWAPKVLAGIGGLPGTVQDRARTVAMRRRLAHEKVDRIRQDRVEQQFKTYRARIRRWADDHVAHLRELDPPTPDGLPDRACDNWRPLLAIADAAGGEWPTRARDAALALKNSDALEEDHGTLLLSDIQELFDDAATPFLVADRIIHYLVSLDERPWSSYSHGAALTAHGLARLLKGFGIRPQKPSANERGYALADFADTFPRYIPQKAATSATRQKNARNSGVVASVADVAGSRGVRLRRTFPRLARGIVAPHGRAV